MGNGNVETSWQVRQTEHSLTLIHDNRWLAIVGVPLMLFGILLGIGPWWIDSINPAEDWPILVGGSVIALGFVVAGLSLCFHYTEISADLHTAQIVQHKGLAPFRRTSTWPINSFEAVACVEERMGSTSFSSSLHYRIRLVGPNNSVLVASCLESDPILQEVHRWSEFLTLPVDDQLNLND